MGRVRRRVGDNRVLGLVKAFLKAGILTEAGLLQDSTAGTPQGGILSPLLANVALSVLDEHIAGIPGGGSNTSFNYAWTTRSATVGIPNRRNVPPVLGIIRSRTGNGQKLRFLTLDRSSSRNSSTLGWPRWTTRCADPPRPWRHPCSR
jgi:hypothetical protein